jgi:hypothetical protein
MTTREHDPWFESRETAPLEKDGQEGGSGQGEGDQPMIAGG